MTATVEEVLDAFPQERVDRDNLGYYSGLLEHRLLINRCRACGVWHQPPQPICPACWTTDVVASEVSGRGTIHLAIHLHQGPGVDPANPYPVVVVELEEQAGLRVTSTIVDCPKDEVQVGLAVELAWIDRDGRPVAVFRPASDAKGERHA